MTYRSAESLVTEYTACVARGGCVLVSARALELGTRFRFEMYASGGDRPLELDGEVVQVQPLPGARQFELGIQYATVGRQRPVLDALLSEIKVDPSYATRRRHPRIPVNLLAHGHEISEVGESQTRYLIRDLSRSGMRVDGRGRASAIAPGGRAVLHVMSAPDSVPFEIPGAVVWTQRGARVRRTRLGVVFDALGDAEQMVVDSMVGLWRPHRLALEIASAPGDALGPAAARFTRTAPDIAELIRAATERRLRELAALALAPTTQVDPRRRAATDVTRIGLVGDVEAELIVETSEELGARVAGEPRDGGARPVAGDAVGDALLDLVSTIASGVCDELDDQGVELELAPPSAGDPAYGAADHVVTAELAGPHGHVALSVVVRAPAAATASG